MPRIDSERKAISNLIALKRELMEQRCYEAFKDNLPGAWISPDLIALDTVVVPPYGKALVPVEAPREKFAKASIFLDALAPANTHTSSRLAQVGLVLDVSPREFVRSASQGAENVQSVIRVGSLGTRPVEIKEGTSIGNIFVAPDHAFLYGKRLENEIASGNINLSGTAGIDWCLDPNKGAVRFTMDENAWKWIPVDDAGSVVEIPSEKGAPYRQMYRERYLQPIQKSEGMILAIGQTTSQLTLSPYVHGIITPLEYRNAPSEHVNSQVIRGGNTAWEIVGEYYGPGRKNLLPREMVMRFVKAV